MATTGKTTGPSTRSVRTRARARGKDAAPLRASARAAEGAAAEDPAVAGGSPANGASPRGTARPSTRKASRTKPAGRAAAARSAKSGTGGKKPAAAEGRKTAKADGAKGTSRARTGTRTGTRAGARNGAARAPRSAAKAPAAPPAPKEAEAPPAAVAPPAPTPELPDGYAPNGDEEYMGALQTEYFRRKLIDWRQALFDESEQTLESMRDQQREVSDDAERASRETEMSFELRTRDRYRKLIRKINEALDRIEDGSYGFCEETGDPIGLGRLEARPIATLSVEAQERREMLERQYRP